MRTIVILGLLTIPVIMTITVAACLIYGLLYTIRCINIAQRVIRRAR